MTLQVMRRRPKVGDLETTLAYCGLLLEPKMRLEWASLPIVMPWPGQSACQRVLRGG